MCAQTSEGSPHGGRDEVVTIISMSGGSACDGSFEFDVSPPLLSMIADGLGGWDSVSIFIFMRDGVMPQYSLSGGPRRHAYRKCS